MTVLNNGPGGMDDFTEQYVGTTFGTNVFLGVHVDSDVDWHFIGAIANVQISTDTACSYAAKQWLDDGNVMLTDSCNFNEGPAVVQLAVDYVAGYTTYQHGKMLLICASEAAPLMLPTAFQADASLARVLRRPAVTLVADDRYYRWEHAALLGGHRLRLVDQGRRDHVHGRSGHPHRPRVCANRTARWIDGASVLLLSCW